jgi:hypothetical protein
MSRLPLVRLLSVFAALTCCAPIAPAQAPACKPGFVFREAFPGDAVCVTPQTRAQVMADNRDAMLHRVSPNKETCIQGYVWREANPQDHVCVLLETKHETDKDNQLAATRIVNSGASAIMSAPAPVYGQRPAPPENRPAESSGPVLPGFHIANAPYIARSARLNLHPRPAPLTGEQMNSIIARYGVHVAGFHLLVPPDITYQLEIFDTSTGAEVNTNYVQSTVFYSSPSPSNQSMGYIQIDFNVNPGIQNLLDCSLGMDGTFNVITSMTGVPDAGGNLSSFNGHLMIPFSKTPSNAKSAQAIIYFSNIEFDGCTVETVSQ